MEIKFKNHEKEYVDYLVNRYYTSMKFSRKIRIIATFILIICIILVLLVATMFSYWDKRTFIFLIVFTPISFYVCYMTFIFKPEKNYVKFVKKLAKRNPNMLKEKEIIIEDNKITIRIDKLKGHILFKKIRESAIRDNKIFLTTYMYKFEIPIFVLIIPISELNDEDKKKLEILNLNFDRY